MTEQYVQALKVACCSWSLSKVEKQICNYRTKGPLWHTKTKAKAELWLWEKGLQWDKIGEESKSIPKVVAKDKPHGEEKKKKPKAGTEKK